MSVREVLLLLSLCCCGALAENNSSAVSQVTNNKSKSRRVLQELWSKPQSLRLVGGSRCHGELQIKRSYRPWTPVDPVGFHLRYSHRACAELDCGPALNATRRRVSPRTALSVMGALASDNSCDDRPLVECIRMKTLESERSLELSCADSVRLVGGQDQCSGTLQIRDPSSSWASVCAGALDLRGAEVLCRELGCGAPVLQGALSVGQTFLCEGHESALMDCPRTRTDPRATANITCSGAPAENSEPFSLRLDGGDGRCWGRLQVQRPGQGWVGVYPQGFTLEFGDRVCAVLGCGHALTWASRADPQREVTSVTPFLYTTAACEDEPLSHCFMKETFLSDSSMELNCTDWMRLVGGKDQCSGTLQIRDPSSSWTSVCAGVLDHRGAEVLCRELGCGDPVLLSVGEQPPLFHCKGHESALKDCPQKQTRTRPETCPGPTVNITCSEPLRLVQGSSRCDGILETRYRGSEWRQAKISLIEPSENSDLHERWPLEATAAVCRNLGCGAAVSAKETYFTKGRSAWYLVPKCVVNKKSARGCVRDSWLSDKYYSHLELVCEV